VVPLRGVKKVVLYPLFSLPFSSTIWMMSLGLALWVLLLALRGSGRVTHMLYADDLTLTANDPVHCR